MALHASTLFTTSHSLLTRATNDTCSCPCPEPDSRPPAYKAVGISLAIASGVFIGISFVLKKVGLLRANVKYNEEAGEGYGYLKNFYWWSGMTLMILGEVCNFVAYAFVDAILVTPLGALSVVITTILSTIFLKERLSFVGKIGCFMCIVGSIIIVMNAPAQSSAKNIEEMQQFVIAPGFLSYAGVIVLGCAFIAFWAGPRYGKRSMLVYLSICSLVGGLSVVATQGLGAAVVAQARGEQQFNKWFLYVLFVFVIATLVTEIIYLNKALNLFNAALVTPTYYVYFTSSTIVSSAILFRGFKGTPIGIATIIMAFLQICAGVVLLQLSKSAKDVPDAKVFTGDLDQVRTVAEQEEPESEPKADAIRGTAAIIRRMSKSRQKNEAAEAKRIHEDKMKDQMEPIGENELVQWDGLRRRKTTLGDGLGGGGLARRKTLHPPLGLTHFPDEDDETTRPNTSQSGDTSFGGSFLNSFRRRQRAQSSLVPNQAKNLGTGTPDAQRPMDINEIAIPPYKGFDSDISTQYSHNPDGAMELDHVFGLPPALQHPAHDPSGGSSRISPSAAGTTSHGKPIMWAADVEDHMRSKASPAPRPPPHGSSGAKRQFSFQNVFHRNKPTPSDDGHSVSRKGLAPRQSSKEHGIPKLKTATEEERLGLVKGDSSHMLPQIEHQSDDDEAYFLQGSRNVTGSSMGTDLGSAEKEAESYDGQSRPWGGRSRGVGESSDSELDPLEGVEYKDKELEYRRPGGGSSGGGGGAFV